jgi:hypothetical protein
MAPIAAAALFAGFFLRSRLVALAVPLLTMAISDLFLEAYNVKIQAAVYAGMCLPVLLAVLLRKEISVPRLVACTLAGSVAFFFLSNGAEWMWGRLYSHDWEGLQLCFTLAIPFFRSSVLGDLIWTSVLFGVHGLVMNRLAITPPDFGTFDKPVPVRVRK